MKTEKYIDEFVAHEKQILPNPYLTQKVMNRLASKELRAVPLWQSLAVAASILLAVVGGVSVGNVMDSTSENYVSLDINDANMENINQYRSIGYE